jgi:hypothetical protein
MAKDCGRGGDPVSRRGRTGTATAATRVRGGVVGGGEVGGVERRTEASAGRLRRRRREGDWGARGDAKVRHGSSCRARWYTMGKI